MLFVLVHDVSSYGRMLAKVTKVLKYRDNSLFQFTPCRSSLCFMS